MYILFSERNRYFIYRSACDMRKGYDGLSGLVLNEFFTEGTYVVSGIDKGNYQVGLTAHTPQYIIGRFGINLNIGQSSADLIYRWYDSNNFYWKNNFFPVLNFKAGIIYELSKFNFSIRANNMIVDKYVYLNGNAFPDQFNDAITINQVIANKNFHYHYWHFDNIITYQKTDHEGIIHLPTWVSDQSLYFEKYYFDNALLASFGLSANYNSSYYADAFMPANSLFYLQNTTKTGGYLRLDLFINAQIKTARIFLKMENAADNLIENSYYLTPHYPMPGRVLKFGVVWKFLDQ